MPMLLLWILVFVVSLATLVKAADWLISSSERLGLAMGISPFIVGVTIVGAGTSMPELVSSFVATYKGLTDVAVANVIGSNIANILLIVGAGAWLAKKIHVTKDVVEIDLPLLILSQVLLLGVVWDARVSLFEAVLLLVAYIVYVHYTATSEPQESKVEKVSFEVKDLAIVAGSVALLAGSSTYLVRAVTELSTLLNVTTGLITVTAVAVGTSLPEFIVTVRAALSKKADVAIGNIIGSNIFNALIVVGIPGLFGTLTVDAKTFALGIPALIAATLVFTFSGLSNRYYRWEGGFYVLVYILFLSILVQ